MATINITIDLPEGATCTVTTTQPDEATGIPADIQAGIDQFAASKYKPFMEMLFSRAIAEYGCIPAFPNSQKRDDEYLSLFTPARCKRARVCAMHYRSGRLALFTEPVDLNGYQYAEETRNHGVYIHPKIAHLDSVEKVEEALELLGIAIDRFSN